MPGRTLEVHHARLHPAWAGWLIAFLLAGGTEPARAQEGPDPAAAADTRDGRRLEVLSSPWIHLPPPVTEDSPPPPDTEELFDAFQRDFAADFGVELRREGERERPAHREKDLADRVGKRLAARFEGSEIFRWYQGAVGVYERLERVHRRLEASTRWNTSGFAIDTDFESVVDGSVKLHVERRVRGFKMGFDVHDATEGRVGLRLGGVVRGYQINFDLGDLGAGRIRLGVKKRLE